MQNKKLISCPKCLIGWTNCPECLGSGMTETYVDEEFVLPLNDKKILHIKNRVNLIIKNNKWNEKIKLQVELDLSYLIQSEKSEESIYLINQIKTLLSNNENYNPIRNLLVNSTIQFQAVPHFSINKFDKPTKLDELIKTISRKNILYKSKDIVRIGNITNISIKNDTLSILIINNSTFYTGFYKYFINLFARKSLIRAKTFEVKIENNYLIHKKHKWIICTDITLGNSIDTVTRFNHMH